MLLDIGIDARKPSPDLSIGGPHRALEDAREKTAAILGAYPDEVIFTSGGTEAINAAVWGAVQARPGGAVVGTAVEHSAVRDASARHAEVIEAGVDGLGRIDIGAFGAALSGAGPAVVAFAPARLAARVVAAMEESAQAAGTSGRGRVVRVRAAGAQVRRS